MKTSIANTRTFSFLILNTKKESLKYSCKADVKN